MADEAPRPPAPFDVRTVKALVSLMTQHDLSEIDLRDGNQRLRLRRGGLSQTVAVAAQPSLPVMSAPPPVASSPAPTNNEPAALKKQYVEIKAPTVGTFYAKPNPDSPPFVKVGAKVTPTTVVCLIEAMKLFNEVNADCSGTVVEILVDNQQPVEYGQVLIRVDPTA